MEAEDQHGESVLLEEVAEEMECYAERVLVESVEVEVEVDRLFY